MRLLFLWLIIGSVAIGSGIALLSNTIDVKAQSMGVFSNMCSDPDNCNPINLPDVFSVRAIENPGEQNTNPWAAEREYTSMTVKNDLGTDNNSVAKDLKPNNINLNSVDGDQGCPASFWIHQSDYQNVTDSKFLWPPGYSPGDKFASPAYFNTKLTGSNIGDPTLLEALNFTGIGIDNLAKQSVTALLNAAHSEVNYPLTITEIISQTRDAISQSDYSVADTFAYYNYLGSSKICS